MESKKIQRLQNPWVQSVILFVVFLGIGFALTAYSPLGWDDENQYLFSRWILSSFGLIGSVGKIPPELHYYAPLWELMLGIATEFIFPWMHDPYWVRHALNLTLCLLCLYWVYALLRKAEVSRTGSLLCVAGLISIIRLGGHATFNTKDAPSAMLFLVAAIAGWHLLKSCEEENISYKKLIGLGLLGVLPYLVRIPLLLLLPLFLVTLGLILLKKKSISPYQKFEKLMVPALSGLCFVILMSPTHWSFNVSDWIEPITVFRQFPYLNIVTRAFGHTWNADAWPWWYPLGWILVIIQPIGFLLWGIGCIWSVSGKEKNITPMACCTFGRIRLTLQAWLFGIFLISCAIIMIMHPKLYNEERHLLFLYPPLFLAGFLGFEYTHEYIKRVAAGMLIFFSVVAYIRWSEYSYVYTSPLAITTSRAAFTGDYWATCAAAGIAHIPLEERHLTVAINAPTPWLMLKRLQKSILLKDPSFNSMKLTHHEPRQGPYLRLFLDSALSRSQAKFLTEQGKAVILWQDNIPSGDVACMLIKMLP